MELSDEERRRRARAAEGYSLMKRGQLAEAMGASRRTLDDLLRVNGRGAPDDELLDKIADACGVPRWFMEYGFNPPAARGLEGAVREIVLRMIDEERRGRREAS